MEPKKARQLVGNFFKDKQGKWLVIQFPNTLLVIWIVLLLVNLLVSSQHIRQLNTAVLFAWAYVELTQGSSYFRKALGAIVLIFVIISFFR